jgi:hypothetical protein
MISMREIVNNRSESEAGKARVAGWIHSHINFSRSGLALWVNAVYLNIALTANKY